MNGEALFGFLISLFVFIFIVAVIYSLIKDKKRKEQFSKYCEQNRIKYQEDSEYIIDCNEKFDITSRGKNQCYYHIMHGTRNDYDFQLIDFYYSIEKTSSKPPFNKYDETFNETLCVIHKKEINFPHFYMLVKGFLNSDVNFLPTIKDYEDIDLIEVKTIDGEDMVLVRTRNEDETLQFFDTSKCEAVQKNIKEDLVYEGNGEYLIVSKLELLSLDDRLKLLENSIKMFEAIS